MNGVQQIGAGVLLIVDNYILGLIWGNDSIYLVDSRSKNENGNLLSSGTVLLIFDTLYLLENYVRSVYYSTFSLTLYFQVQFIKFHCPATAENAIKSELKQGAIVSKMEERFPCYKNKIS